MKNSLLFLCCIYLSSVSFYTFAKLYNMDVPVFWQQKNLGDLVVSMDGMKVKAVDKSSLEALLNKSVNKQFLSWIRDYPTQTIPLTAKPLKQLDIQFDSRNVKLNMQISELVLSTSELSYKRNISLPTMSKAANWAVLNNLQLQYVKDQQQNSQLLDWNIFVNQGGHQGINFESSLHFENSDNDGQTQYRGDTFFYYEDHTQPFRISFGDVNSITEGHANTGSFGGINFSPSFRRLQPNSVISPIGSQQFYLPQVAQLEVFINGYMVVKSRLNAGKYDLSDLPLRSGENDVTLVATYANGEKETFVFNEFYNPLLLEQGKYDYDVTIGAPVEIVDSTYNYANQLMLTGFFKYGLTQHITAGTNITASDYGHILGLSFITNFSFGNVYSRFSQSKNTQGEEGHAISLNTEHFIWGKRSASVANLRFTLEQKDQFTANFWSSNLPAITNKRLGVTYLFSLANNVDSNINFNRYLNKNSDNYNSAQLNINWRLPNIKWTASYKHNSQLTDFNQDENQLSLDFSWHYFNPHRNVINRVEYKSYQNKLTGTASKLNRNHVGSTGYQVSLDQEPENQLGTVELNHSQKYARMSVTATHQANEYTENTNYRANVTTSIAIVDGKLGIGNNIRTPYAFVAKHASLKNAKVVINSNNQDPTKFQSYSEPNIAGLVNLGTPYATNRVAVNVENAPLGYDWGPGVYEVVSGANAAYPIQVGSNSSYTVIGYVVDKDGNGISLKRGVFKSESGQYKFFTNKTGRFVVEGVELGKYVININNSETQVDLTAIQNDSMLLRVGKLQLGELVNE